MDALLDDGCLRYDGADGPQRRTQAAQQLHADPALADANIFVASMLGRSDAVAAFLTDDASRATARGGPRDWPPLLYLAYGRVARCRDDESYVAAATALLDAGADPNSFYISHGVYRFTALTGAFGEGESGPRAQPEHDEANELAELLLQRGADPNDGQALYNRMFTPGSTCLRMLIDAGLSPTDRIDWPADEQDARPRPTTMSYQLYHAARKGFVERVELLLDAGVDVHEREHGGMSVWKAAVLGGRAKIADRLAAAGAETEGLDDPDRFTAAFRGARHDEARSMLTADPEIFEAAEGRHGDLLMHAVDQGDLAGIELALSTGIDINRNRHTPMAHHAAIHGQLEALQRVLARGADPMLKDVRFNATALDWALHAGQAQTAAYLQSLSNEEQ